MRISFARTGGFAAIRLAGTIDTDTLPKEEAQALQSELESARFFELPARLTGQSGGADRFQYEITVDDGGRQHTIEAGEASIPGNIQPLVEHLERLVRTKRS